MIYGRKQDAEIIHPEEPLIENSYIPNYVLFIFLTILDFILPFCLSPLDTDISSLFLFTSYRF